MRYVKINFWPGIHISDLHDLNQQARTWLNAVANPRIHATTNSIPFHRLPQEKLQALPDVRYDTSIVTSRRSRKDCLVSYQGNFYSVPAVYACQILLVKETETGDLFVVNHLGEMIAQHRLLAGQRQRSVDPVHYQSLTTHADSSIPSILPFIELAPQVEVRPLSVYAAWVEEE